MDFDYLNIFNMGIVIILFCEVIFNDMFHQSMFLDGLATRTELNFVPLHL